MLANFKSAVQTLDNSDVVSFLRLALTSSEARTLSTGPIQLEPEIYAKLVMQLEEWYKEFTERLTLWYKKRMRKKMFVIAILVSVLVNVDSIQLFNFYKLNPSARNSIINYYQSYSSADSTTRKMALTDLHNTANSLDSLSKTADLPVGFDYSIFVSPPAKDMIIWKIMGILISGICASFGGPFWFEMLRKIYSKAI